MCMPLSPTTSADSCEQASKNEAPTCLQLSLPSFNACLKVGQEGAVLAVLGCCFIASTGPSDFDGC